MIEKITDAFYDGTNGWLVVSYRLFGMVIYQRRVRAELLSKFPSLQVSL